ncbi:MAG: hypothetical protein ABIF88_00780 [archaeon]
MARFTPYYERIPKENLKGYETYPPEIRPSHEYSEEIPSSDLYELFKSDSLLTQAALTFKEISARHFPQGKEYRGIEKCYAIAIEGILFGRERQVSEKRINFQALPLLEELEES